ncbi:MAG: adenylosuccinate lyase [Candidatus Hodarchaeales archaeon]|jgi:adenylosuccinate lyase
MTFFPYERYKTPMAILFQEEKQLELQLLIERSLANANAKYGKIPREAAEEIDKFARLEYVKLKRVKEIEKETHHDLYSVVLAATEVCPTYGEFIHLGATSSDIQDTVNALQLTEAKQAILKRINKVSRTLIRLAEQYRDLVCIGRTHGQHAIPITYGFKFANYLSELFLARNTFENTNIYGKLSGAVGTYAAYETSEIEKSVMDSLNLKTLPITTQVIPRIVFFHFLSALIGVVGVLDKIAKEFRDLQRTEIGEIIENYNQKQVGSSAMPQKRNPWRLERICGIARYLRSLLPSILENVSLEHERDMTNSSVERLIIPRVFTLTDFVLLELQTILTNISISKDNVTRNLLMLDGRQCSERLLGLLTASIGRQKAHLILRELSSTEKFREAVKNHPEITKLYSEEELEEFLDPYQYIGLAPQLVDRVVKEVEKTLKNQF